jgi:hypothetical protein
MALVRVWTDIGARKPVALLAKVIEKDGFILTIKYLSEGPDHVWRYEDDTYDIDDDSVAEYLKTDHGLTEMYQIKFMYRVLHRYQIDFTQ